MLTQKRQRRRPAKPDIPAIIAILTARKLNSWSNIQPMGIPCGQGTELRIQASRVEGLYFGFLFVKRPFQVGLSSKAYIWGGRGGGAYFRMEICVTKIFGFLDKQYTVLMRTRIPHGKTFLT